MGRAVYIMTSGELSRKDNTILLDFEGGRKYIPIETTDELMVFSEVSFNKRFLEFLAKCEVIMHFFNHYGGYVGTYYPKEHLNSGAVVLAQARHFLENGMRVDLASRFVKGALENMIRVLRYYENRKGGVSDLEEELEEYGRTLHNVRTVPELMGIEGKAKDRYFDLFDRLVGDGEFEMGKRVRRPPNNKMNALLSFGNSLCYVAALSQIYRTHLDPRIGYLHETNFRRFSLNLDVAEVFKPILVDRMILSLVNKGEIKPVHFMEKGGGVWLNDKGRELVLKRWEERLNETIEHPRLKRSVSYRSLIRLELYKLERHILGEGAYEPFVSRW